MKNSRFIKLITIFIIIQPIFDVIIYFTSKVLDLNIPSFPLLTIAA